VARAIRMPSMSMYMAEGTLVAWLCPSGSRVASGEAVAEVETEKATFALEAPVAGILHPVAHVGTTMPIEAVLGYVLSPGEEPPAPPSQSVALNPPKSDGIASGDLEAPPSGSAGGLRASPIARRLAGEHGLDLARMTGTGPAGRIVEADIRNALAAREKIAGGPMGAAAIRQRIPMAGLRRTIADRLRQGLAHAVPLTLTREVCADRLVAARKRHAVDGDRIGYDAWFIKLLAAGLRECPDLNATVTDDAILVWEDVHVGFAVAVPGGVVVPVIHHADTTPLSRLAALVRDLGRRAREGTLHPKDTSGGTITVTNLGASAIDAFTPILNPPQSAILGVGRIAERPVVADGGIVPGQTCVLSLTFDHRVSDGVPAARLLAVLARLLNDDAYLSDVAHAG